MSFYGAKIIIIEGNKLATVTHSINDTRLIRLLRSVKNATIAQLPTQ